MKTQTQVTLAYGIILAFIATGCSSDGNADFSNAETVSQYIPYDGQSLTVDTGTSDLVLISGSSDEVKIDQQIAGTANGESPETTEILDGDMLNLSVDCNGFGINCKGRFTVTVPEDVAVNAQSKNSQIEVSNFSSDLTVSAVNGNAVLSQISSSKLTLTGKGAKVTGTGLSAKEVSTDTRNGDIDLTFSEAPDQVTINSHDGNVRLALPDLQYHVDVTTKKNTSDVSVPQSDTSKHIISVTTRNGDVDVSPVG